MTITLINGYVLFAHRADWSKPAKHKRIWETGIIGALPGQENRAALRAVARRQLTFTIDTTTRTLQERVRLEARIDAAKLSGLGCAPLHGRASFLSQAINAGSMILTLSNDFGWNWQAGDYAILLSDDLTFDVQTVTSVANDGLGHLTLALNAALVNNWPVNSLVWPVIFGAFTAANESASTGWYGAIALTISERVSARSVQIGVTPAQPPGVGQQVIGKTNKVT